MTTESELPSARRILAEDAIDTTAVEGVDGKPAACEVRQTLSKLRKVLQVRGE